MAKKNRTQLNMRINSDIVEKISAYANETGYYKSFIYGKAVLIGAKAVLNFFSEKKRLPNLTKDLVSLSKDICISVSFDEKTMNLVNEMQEITGISRNLALGLALKIGAPYIENCLKRQAEIFIKTENDAVEDFASQQTFD